MSVTFAEAIVGIVGDEIVKKRRLLRDAWIAVARSEFRASARESCCVCGKHRAITHAHHIVPLNWQYRIGIDNAYHSHVWLCPNHHTILHAFLDGDEVSKETSTAIHLLADTSKVEREKLLHLYEDARQTALELHADD